MCYQQSKLQKVKPNFPGLLLLAFPTTSQFYQARMNSIQAVGHKILRKRLVDSSEVANYSVWKFLLDDETNHLYKIIHVDKQELKKPYKFLMASHLRTMECQQVRCHTVLLAAQHKRTHPVLNPASKAGIRFAYPWRMEGWVDLGALIMPRPGTEPTMAWLKVRRPNRCTTKTHGSWIDAVEVRVLHQGKQVP